MSSLALVMLDKRGYLDGREAIKIITELRERINDLRFKLDVEIGRNNDINKRIRIMCATTVQREWRYYPNECKEPECKSRETLAAAGFVYSGLSEPQGFFDREIWVKRDSADPR